MEDAETMVMEVHQMQNSATRYSTTIAAQVFIEEITQLWHYHLHRY